MKVPTFKPISDRVIMAVKEEDQDKTLGGIVMPESSKDKLNIGECLAIGPGSQRETGANKHEMSDLSVGKHYVFEKYGGFNFKLWGKSYLSIRRRSVLAEFEDDSKIDSVTRF